MSFALIFAFRASNPSVLGAALSQNFQRIGSCWNCTPVAPRRNPIGIQKSAATLCVVVRTLWRQVRRPVLGRSSDLLHPH